MSAGILPALMFAGFQPALEFLHLRLYLRGELFSKMNMPAWVPAVIYASLEAGAHLKQ